MPATLQAVPGPANWVFAPVHASAVVTAQVVPVQQAPPSAGQGPPGQGLGAQAEAAPPNVSGATHAVGRRSVQHPSGAQHAAGINGTDGVVEAINLRTIVLRDIEGTVHVFPNGAINTLANRSKDFSYYVVDLSVSYYDDTDRVAATVREVGASLQADPAFGSSILAPIEILGVDAFGEWAIKMKARIKTMPLKQWEVGRELRRRLIKAFERNGFAIPFPVPATAVHPATRPEGQ